MAQTPQQLAQAAAAASVPTVKSIDQQYGRSQQDTAGFTKALIDLLQQENPGDAYQSATASQEAINNAVANRLAAAGSPYAAGSAAATAGMGGSALGNLVSQGAAANAYGAKMPAVAAGRGQMAQQSLITAQHQALQQRAQTFASNFQTALQDARSFDLQKQSATTSRNEFNANLAFQREQAAESKHEFNVQEADKVAAASETGTGTSVAAGSPAASVAKSLGLTPNEFQTRVQDAAQNLPPNLTVAVKAPNAPGGKREVMLPFTSAVHNLIEQGGYAPQVALFAAARIYSRSRSSTPAAWFTYAVWMADNGSTKYRRIVNRLTTNPGNPAPGHSGGVTR